MARYEIRIEKAAKKQLAKLPARDAERVGKAIDAQGTNPFPEGAKAMSGGFAGAR
jgi:mRNA-degrading endonuclease RelE of RelBE toxin-antitoxin system